MTQSRHFQVAGALVALLLLTFTIVDWFALVSPLQPREMTWRFAAFTSLSGSLLTPALGMLLLLGVADLGHRRWLHRTISVVLLMIGLGLGAACVLLVFDFLQIRAGLRPEAVARFEVGSLRSLAKLALGSIAALALSAVALLAARAAPAAHSPQRARHQRVQGGADPMLLRRPSSAGSEEPAEATP